jgi:5-methylcytosine-specific restriction protein A
VTSSADFDPGFEAGGVLANRELAAAFKCSTQGGMRRSKQTNSLLITTSRDALYLDRWHDGVLHYTGMGQTGDQQLDRQNRTLAESGSNGVAVFLAEVFGPNEYTYIGRIELAGEPYQEEQPDLEGELRKVWMFPLRPAGGDVPAPVPAEMVRHAAAVRERAARRLSDEELSRRARGASREAGRRPTTSTTYERDPYVSELAKRRAAGYCQLCGQPAPFKSRRGEPYLETHHIVWLARGGEDSIGNTVALCPNCHRRVHELDAGSDINALKGKAGEL